MTETSDSPATVGTENRRLHPGAGLGWHRRRGGFHRRGDFLFGFAWACFRRVRVASRYPAGTAAAR